ncbi:DotH/IcmK family type IV secretion protein, partial [Leptospirillum ferriphilum]|uniref:DotH/IcmK family type IV secretion protein n=1 Tax=Leptospirillum ferriphilum TaxID=178606 RepID=UPI0012376BAE
MKKSNSQKKALGRGLESLMEGETPVHRENFSSSPMTVVVFSLVAFVLGAASHAVFSNLSPGPPKASAVSLLPSPPSSVPGGGGSPVASGSEDRPSGSADVVPALPPPSRFHDTVVRESIHKNFPLTPDDIKLIRKTLKETQKAVHGAPPVGRAVSVSVSLDPGAPFPDIHLVPGIATTITVVDATGAPWPIEDVIVGNKKSFPVKRLSTPNGVVVEPKNNVGWTSLALSLKGR